MSETSAPTSAYLVALILAFGLAGLTVIAFLWYGPGPMTTYLVPSAATAAGALAFALLWPGPSWRWGVVLSCGFLAFFAAVFVFYLTVGELVWIPLWRSLVVLLAGLAAALLGARLRGPGAPERGPRS